jgi:hypothetical protein
LWSATPIALTNAGRRAINETIGRDVANEPMLSVLPRAEQRGSTRGSRSRTAGFNCYSSIEPQLGRFAKNCAARVCGKLRVSTTLATQYLRVKLRPQLTPWRWCQRCSATCTASSRSGADTHGLPPRPSRSISSHQAAEPNRGLALWAAAAKTKISADTAKRTEMMAFIWPPSSCICRDSQILGYHAVS